MTSLGGNYPNYPFPTQTNLAIMEISPETAAHSVIHCLVNSAYQVMVLLVKAQFHMRKYVDIGSTVRH